MTADNTVEIAFRPYVGHRPTRQYPKGYRTYAPQLMEDFIESLAGANGGRVEKPQLLPEGYYELDGHIYHEQTGRDVTDYYDEYERRVEVEYDLTVLRGKVFVDWVNRKIYADPKLFSQYIGGHRIADFYSKPKVSRIKRIPKLETVATSTERTPYGTFTTEYADLEKTNPISYMDKHSYACAFCEKPFGYKNNAVRCSHTHIAYSLIDGDLFAAGIESIKPSDFVIPPCADAPAPKVEASEPTKKEIPTQVVQEAPKVEVQTEPVVPVETLEERDAKALAKMENPPSYVDNTYCCKGGKHKHLESWESPKKYHCGCLCHFKNEMVHVASRMSVHLENKQWLEEYSYPHRMLVEKLRKKVKIGTIIYRPGYMMDYFEVVEIKPMDGASHLFDIYGHTIQNVIYICKPLHSTTLGNVSEYWGHERSFDFRLSDIYDSYKSYDGMPSSLIIVSQSYEEIAPSISEKFPSSDLRDTMMVEHRRKYYSRRT